MKKFYWSYPLTAFFFILLFCIAGLLIINGFKKDQGEKQATEITPASTFFTVPSSTDPLVAAIVNSLQRQSKDGAIESQLPHHAGVPKWDKAMVSITASTNAGKAGTGMTDPVKVILIPFVWEDKKQTHAMLRVKVTSIDTSYQLIYADQYPEFGFEKKEKAKWNALNLFHQFTRFYNAIFGHRNPGITPGNLCFEPDEGWQSVLLPIIPAEDPFVVANNAAKKMDSIYLNSNAESLLNSIPNLATQSVEKGFGIVKEIKINPQNVKDTSVIGYRTDDVCTGTETNIDIIVTTDRLEVLGASLHSHPSTVYSAPSAKDVYDLINNCLNNYYFEGIFVAASNGSRYALTITNLEQATAFIATKNQYLAPGGKWNASSDIGKEFMKATIYFEKKFKGNPNQIHLAYEMAMGAALGQYNTGMILCKQNAAGNFKPLIVKTAPDPRKPQKTIYIQEYL